MRMDSDDLIPVSEWLSALSHNRPTPAGGSLALVTLAGAAALTAKLARLSGIEEEIFAVHADRFHRFAREDSEYYVAAAGGDRELAKEAIRQGRAQLTAIGEFLGALETMREAVKPVLTPDLEAALTLGMAAEKVLSGNLKANLAHWGLAEEGF